MGGSSERKFARLVGGKRGVEDESALVASTLAIESLLNLCKSGLMFRGASRGRTMKIGSWNFRNREAKVDAVK